MFIFLSVLSFISDGETLVLTFHCITGSSSEPKKDDEVKKLPGGKVKKKVTFQVLTFQILCINILYSNLGNNQISSTPVDIVLLFQEKPEVVVEKIVRNKRKCVTIIKGLDMFGKCNFISLPILILL